MNINIDESKFTESPGFLKRVLNAVLTIIYAILFIQIILFSVSRFTSLPPSVFLLFENYFFLGTLVIAAVFGWIYGAEFHGWLRNKMEEWNLWGFWN